MDPNKLQMSQVMYINFSQRNMLATSTDHENNDAWFKVSKGYKLCYKTPGASTKGTFTQSTYCTGTVESGYSDLE